MKSKSFAGELSSIVRNKMVLIPVIAVMLVPLLYAGMFLWAFWDPYAKMDILPVAVINNDKGAEFNDKTMNVGGELVDKLKEGKDFDWQFVSKDVAMKGLSDRTYYMAIEIPEDFSQKVVTVTDEKPERAEVKYIPNESYNFLAAQIGKTAVERIQGELSKSVTEAYSKAVFSSVEKLSDGIGQAGDGATKLADGSKSVDDGVKTIKENLDKLAKGATDLNNGVQLVDVNTGKLVSGASQLKDGINTLDSSAGKLSAGANELKKGAEALDAGLGKLVAGASPMKEGISSLQQGAGALTTGLGDLNTGATTLSDGLGKLADGASQLSAGAEKAETGVAQLQKGLTTSKESLTKLSTGADGISNGLQAYAKAHPELAQDPNFAKLLETSKAVSQGLTSVTTGQDQLIAGAEQLATGSTQLKTGISTISTKLTEVAAGGEKLSDGATKLQVGAQQLGGGIDKLAGGADQLVSGADQLQAGAKKLATGAGQLAGGTDQLTAGTGKLAAGADALASGTQQLNDGTHKLANGAEQVATGAQKLDEGTVKLQDGADQLADGNSELATKLTDATKQTGSLNTGDENAKMFAGPVTVSEERYTEVPNYGTGFAPYFISLGLFIGALLLTIVFQIKQPAVAPKNGITWFFSKFMVTVLVGVLQAVILDTFLLYGLGLEVQSIPLFYILTIITSVTFMAIIQFLVSAFANAGRFVGIILLIFQLTTSAGTFPKELLPDFLQKFHKLLPMTYSVFGFKDVISSGDFSTMWQNTFVLIGFIVAFMLLSLGFYTFMFSRHKDEFKQAEVTA
ncbi:YhgE/Pip domain-containing protein [Gorillibacterium sp. CAU 1737]|uniref:YhgE/Pip domain-containing protein n=1 Tax=Gorillibacterium sp. CAU 1737 TaxID=3140362 RepID=UPI003260822D